jgi:UDP-N-acetylglucosamine 2-epimerase (non-hydrolysing)
LRPPSKRGDSEELNVSVVAVIGTRPEAIKMAPVIKALARRGIPTKVVGTGQHSDWKMLGTFLASFDLPLDEQLELTARDLLGSFVMIMSRLGELLQRERPRLVLAQGDTTTVAAAAFAARKTGCAFGHVEAGLRAFSRELPEEEHRICADALADLLFAPTRIAQENLVREHVNGTIVLTGNTVLDALLSHPPRPPKEARREGILVTLHRQETVDDPLKFAAALGALGVLARHHTVEWPMHPRAQAKLAELGLAMPPSVRAEAPLGHGEFLERLVRAELVVTDSGGVQEEAAILGTPCVAVRSCTERPETLTAGVGILAGVDKQGILSAAEEILRNFESYARPVPHLYGDGRAGEKIAEACAEFLGVVEAVPATTAATRRRRALRSSG